jgi:hypothetical protein
LSKSLDDKLAAIRAAEAAFDAAVRDLNDPSTGEALLPGESVADLPAETSYANAAGVVIRSRLRAAVQGTRA